MRDDVRCVVARRMYSNLQLFESTASAIRREKGGFCPPCPTQRGINDLVTPEPSGKTGVVLAGL